MVVVFNKRTHAFNGEPRELLTKLAVFAVVGNSAGLGTGYPLAHLVAVQFQHGVIATGTTQAGSLDQLFKAVTGRGQTRLGRRIIGTFLPQ